MAFTKGNKLGKKFTKENQPKNNGRPPKLPELDVLMADILGEEKDGKSAAYAILAKLRAKAANGDIRAAEVLLNRGYGVPRQTIDMTVKETDVDFTF
jgi:nucleotide-binding universal stress UspA family protein